jgi:hypothetical protein
MRQCLQIHNFISLGALGVLSACLIVSAGVWPTATVADAPKLSVSGEPGAVATAASVGASDSPGMKLAQRYLSDLVPVLEHLRDHEPEQYDKAIRDLDRAAKRLETLQRRDAELHKLALREWQTRGRVDLLKARLRVRRTDADVRLLLTQMRSLRDIELKRLARERELLAEREAQMAQRAAQAQQVAERSRRQIEELDQQINRLTSQPVHANSPAYLRAIGAGRGQERPANSAPTNDPTKPSVPTKKSRAPQ